MNNEELNTELYKKLFAEQENFKGWLLSQPPTEILNHAYEYVMKEDILLALEFHDLTDEQAKALLSSPSPLEDIYQELDKTESGLMDTVRDCIESRANILIERQKEEMLHTPVYKFNAAYAREHGEIDAYRASNKANVECRYSIEAAIKDHYSDNRLDVSCAKDIIAAYGIDRVQTVLASTIRAADWDGRISDSNKAWAKSYPIPDGSTIEYHVNGCHRGLTDLFCTAVRKEAERLAERKPSVLKKLNHLKADDVAVPTHKPKEVLR